MVRRYWDVPITTFFLTFPNATKKFTAVVLAGKRYVRRRIVGIAKAWFTGHGGRFTLGEP
jgi:hypothetical protein